MGGEDQIQHFKIIINRCFPNYRQRIWENKTKKMAFGFMRSVENFIYLTWLHATERQNVNNMHF